MSPYGKNIMITQDEVKRLFKYVQGDLYWKVNLGTRGKAGYKAGNLSKNGYFVVQINKRQYYIHRLIYLYHYGYMPKMIDHKHGKAIGNYIWNLRPCTVSENMSNRQVNKNNKSGFRCVLLDKITGKWYGRVRFKGDSYLTPLKDTPQEASALIEKKRNELHGKFYNYI